MSYDNKLELVIEIDTKQGTTEILKINRGLSEFEKHAVRVTGRVSQSFDGMVTSWVKVNLGAEALKETFKMALEAIKEFTVGAIENMAMMGHLAEKVGLSVEEISGLAHVAKLTDQDLEGLTASVKILSKNMLAAAAGGSEQAKAFRMLGVEYRNANGSLRPTMDVLDALSDKFKELPDGAYKTAIAQKLMGKSAIDMIPMLNLGGEAIRNYRKEAEELGLVVGEKTVEEAEKFDKSVIRIKAALSGLANKLSEEILPYLNEFLKSVVEWFKSGGLQQTVIQMKSSLDLIAQALLLIKKIVVEIVNVVLNMVLLFSKAAWTLMRIATIPLPAWMRAGEFHRSRGVWKALV